MYLITKIKSNQHSEKKKRVDFHFIFNNFSISSHLILINFKKKKNQSLTVKNLKIKFKMT